MKSRTKAIKLPFPRSTLVWLEFTDMAQIVFHIKHALVAKQAFTTLARLKARLPIFN